MTQKELIYIKTIADEGSVSRAARRLFISQPALSHCVAAIEEELGVPLFLRSPKGLTLTFAGERYYATAVEILRLYSDLEQEIGEMNDLRRGRVTIGMASYAATQILPCVLPDFIRQYPNLEVNLHENTSSGLFEELIARQLDFAVLHIPERLPPEVRESIHFLPVSRDPFVLAAQKNSPLRRFADSTDSTGLPILDPVFLKDQQFLMISKGKSIRSMSDQILEQAGIAPRILLTTANFETARRLASQGVGVTFLPREYTTLFAPADECDYFAIPERYRAFWTLTAATVKDIYITRASRIFIRKICEKFGSADSVSEMDCIF